MRARLKNTVWMRLGPSVRELASGQALGASANCSFSQASRPISCRCAMEAGVAPQLAISRKRTASANGMQTEGAPLAVQFCATACGITNGVEVTVPGLGLVTLSATWRGPTAATVAVAVMVVLDTTVVVSATPPRYAVAPVAKP